MPILGGCLCFDLPTGSKLIGAIYLFCAIINTLSLAITNIALWAMGMAQQLLDILDSAAKEMEHDRKSFAANFSSDYDDHSKEQSEEQMRVLREFLRVIRTNIDTVMIVMLVFLCLSFLSIITSSMLIHGIRKRMRAFLLPWVIQEIIHIIVGIACSVLVFMLLGSAQQAWLTALPIVFTIFIEVYFIIVVISQYQALELIRMQDEMCMK